MVNGLHYYRVANYERDHVPAIGETVKFGLRFTNTRGREANVSVRLVVIDVEHNVVLDMPGFKLIELKVVPHPTSTNYWRLTEGKRATKRYIY